jgi:uncharacterized protein YajQ (UPF0234 family)
MKIEKGTVLIAIDECKMKLGGHKALVIGKEYDVLYHNNYYFIIESEIDSEHQFTFHDANKYFKLKDQSELELGSKENKSVTAVEWVYNILVKHIDPNGVNSYLFDIVLETALEKEKMQHRRTWKNAIETHIPKEHIKPNVISDFDYYKIH